MTAQLTKAQAHVLDRIRRQRRLSDGEMYIYRELLDRGLAEGGNLTPAGRKALEKYDEGNR